jgi:hypothetical protein
MNPDQTNDRMAIPAKRGPGRPTNAEIAARQEVPADVLPVVQYAVRCPCCGIHVFPVSHGNSLKRDGAGKPLTVSRT